MSPQTLLLVGSSLRGLPLQGLRAHADDPDFQKRWAEVKGVAKAKAMARIQELTGEALPQNAMLDIQARAPPCWCKLYIPRSGTQQEQAARSRTPDGQGHALLLSRAGEAELEAILDRLAVNLSTQSLALHQVPSRPAVHRGMPRNGCGVVACLHD